MAQGRIQNNALKLNYLHCSRHLITKSKHDFESCLCFSHISANFITLVVQKYHQLPTTTYYQTVYGPHTSGIQIMT